MVSDDSYFFSKNSNDGTSRLYSILKASHSILLLDFVRLLLVKAFVHSVALSGTFPHPQFMPSLTCSNLAAWLTPDASVSDIGV